MRKIGAGKTVEAGVIAKYILGDPAGQRLCGGRAFTTDFIKTRPTWPSASPRPGPRRSTTSRPIPKEARKHLAKNTLTPDDLVDTVPMLGYIMAKDMTAKQKDEFQKFIDFGVADRRRAGEDRRHQVSSRRSEGCDPMNAGAALRSSSDRRSRRRVGRSPSAERPACHHPRPEQALRQGA